MPSAFAKASASQAFPNDHAPLAAILAADVVGFCPNVPWGHITAFDDGPTNGSHGSEAVSWFGR